MAEIKKRKRRLGDRYDGFRVLNTDPLFQVIPHIMTKRDDSQIFFEEEIDINGLRAFILEQKKAIPTLSTYQLFTAAILRTIVDLPRLNRFVSGKKLYSRSYLRASLTIKKGMDKDAEEALVMPEFTPNDTLKDITEKFAAEIAAANPEGEEKGNATDTTARLIAILPSFIKSFVVWSIRTLDGFGLMPKIINKVSPFHSSIFITNVGSIGINPVYHHLYNFGTTSLFMAIGKKEMRREVQADGSVSTKHFINVRFVVDERICDGYYFAAAIKRFKYYVKNPHLLLAPPEEISEDY